MVHRSVAMEESVGWEWAEPAALGPCWEEGWGRIMHEICSCKGSWELLAVECCVFLREELWRHVGKGGFSKERKLAFSALRGREEVTGLTCMVDFTGLCFSQECLGNLMCLYALFKQVLLFNDVALQGCAVQLYCFFLRVLCSFILASTMSLLIFYTPLCGICLWPGQMFFCVY